ncbi:unnamed protein product [Arctia plantaginis]|uniref:CSN12-like protein n=1 Tax=Arctia plantaginis TaxID=874455 RepID=A0A8S1BBB6_ARCPL|nr:unnamed protein product [Arctia plantaginis]
MYTRRMLSTCTLGQYVKYAEHMYLTNQGLVLSHALSLSDVHVSNEKLFKNIEFDAYMHKENASPIDTIIKRHLLCVKFLREHNFIVAYYHQSSCVTDVVTALRNQTGANWMLPVMYVVSSDLRIVAQKADTINNRSGDILEKATDVLMACYRVCIGDTPSIQGNSKRMGLMSPVNHIMNIYFRTQKFNLCQEMIRTIDAVARDVPSTIQQQVIFRFFVGRLAVLEGDFRVANHNLLFAFKQSHPNSYKNKRIILTYLLPVKMLLGYMPPKAFVEKYNLPIFWELLLAVKQGNLKKFEDVFEGNRRYFIDMGLYLAIENLRLLTYRNLFKRIYHSQRSNKITVSCFQAGLQLMSQEDVDASKTRLLIATLIYSNKMKAYLSYQRDLVIFYSENAFPRSSNFQYGG